MMTRSAVIIRRRGRSTRASASPPHGRLAGSPHRLPWPAPISRMPVLSCGAEWPPLYQCDAEERGHDRRRDRAPTHPTARADRVRSRRRPCRSHEAAASVSVEKPGVYVDRGTSSSVRTCSRSAAAHGNSWHGGSQRRSCARSGSTVARTGAPANRAHQSAWRDRS